MIKHVQGKNKDDSERCHRLPAGLNVIDLKYANLVLRTAATLQQNRLTSKETVKTNERSLFDVIK